MNFQFPEIYLMSNSIFIQLTNLPRTNQNHTSLKKVKSVVTVLALEVNYLILSMFYVYHKLSLKSN